jgi:HSP20 family protein
MPMDAWRDGEQIVVQFDLPGVDMYSVDLDVPRNVLTVRAERRRSTGEDTEMIAAERPRGMLRRQLILGDTPDTDRVHASYSAGVLTLRIPVAEKANPCKITNAVPDADRAALTG